VRQEDALSPFFLNLDSVRIVQKINITVEFTQGQTTVRLLAYADVIAIIGNIVEEVKLNDFET